MNDFDYIKNFSKIKITELCEKNKIDRVNLLNKKTKKSNAKIIREEIESELAKLYIKDDKKDE